MIKDDTVKATVFRNFLKRVIASAKQPISLVIDGHPTGKSKLVRELFESLEGKL